MQTRRWTNQGLPQLLQYAVFFLYFEAVVGFILRQSPDIGEALIRPNFDNGGTIDLLNTLGLLLVVAGGAAAGYFIANEKKNGWYLGLAVAALPLVTRVLIALRYGMSHILDNPLGLMFDAALMGLLVHDQSRNYIRIWFKK